MGARAAAFAAEDSAAAASAMRRFGRRRFFTRGLLPEAGGAQSAGQIPQDPAGSHGSLGIPLDRVPVGFLEPTRSHWLTPPSPPTIPPPLTLPCGASEGSASSTAASFAANDSAAAAFAMRRFGRKCLFTRSLLPAAIGARSANYSLGLYY